MNRPLARAEQQVAGWRTVDTRQRGRIAELSLDLERLSARIANGELEQNMPWDARYRWGEDTLTHEGQEMLVSLLIEPHGDRVDELADYMGFDEDVAFHIDGTMSTDQIKKLIEHDYAWALATDYQGTEAVARFWYVSEVKLEPRLGERYAEPGVELEQPFAVGRDVADLYRALKDTAHLSEHVEVVKVTAGSHRNGCPAHHPRTVGVKTPLSVWRAIEAFSKRTYVPATEESRAKGAGAGRTDND